MLSTAVVSDGFLRGSDTHLQVSGRHPVRAARVCGQRDGVHLHCGVQSGPVHCSPGEHYIHFLPSLIFFSPFFTVQCVKFLSMRIIVVVIAIISDTASLPQSVMKPFAKACMIQSASIMYIFSSLHTERFTEEFVADFIYSLFSSQLFSASLFASSALHDMVVWVLEVTIISHPVPSHLYLTLPAGQRLQSEPCY
jgi:hypothetical protein